MRITSIICIDRFLYFINVHISLNLSNSLYGKITYPLFPKFSPQEFLIINPSFVQPTIDIACPPKNVVPSQKSDI